MTQPTDDELTLSSLVGDLIDALSDELKVEINASPYVQENIRSVLVALNDERYLGYLDSWWLGGDEVARIVLPGSEGYWNAYDKGRELEDLFPGQDGYDFASACEYNDMGPLTGDVGVAGLLMVKQGERDEADWIWLVHTSDGAHWWAVGWCDYTGWDCQSKLDWQPYEEPALADDCFVINADSRAMLIERLGWEYFPEDEDDETP